MNSFEGVFSLLLTPFHADGSIDVEAYDRYVDWQLGHGPDGLFAVCGTSEMKWLEPDERLELARRAVALAGDTPVVATANLGPDRSRHPDEIARMAQTGVAGVVLVPPPGMGADQAALGDYLAALIDGAPLPALLYEWPFNTPHLVDAEVVAALASHGLRAVKDTTCTVEGIRAKIAAAPSVAVHQANTPFLLEAVAAGARGMMAITTSAYGDLGVAAFRAAGDPERRPEAERLHHDLVVVDAFMRTSYPRSAKFMVAQRGVEFGLHCRWPGALDAEVAKALTVMAAALASG